MRRDSLSLEAYKQTREVLGIGNRAIKKVQEENHKKGNPNAYSYSGHIYYELLYGELTREDPIKNLNHGHDGIN